MGTQPKPVVYRSCTPVVDTQYENGGSRTLTETIVDALAEAADRDVTEISPLYETIDPEVLSQMFERNETMGDTVISFSHGNWQVFVRADGRIRVCDSSRSTDIEPVFSGPTV